MDYSSVGPPQVTDRARKPVPAWAPVHRLQLLAGVCSNISFPQAAASFRASSSAVARDAPWAAVWIYAPLWTSMGYRWATCISMVFSRGWRGISAPAHGAPSAPPYSLNLVSAGLFLPHDCHSSLTAAGQHFFSFLKYVITESPPSWLMGSAVPCGGPLKLVKFAVVQHRAAPASPHRGCPAATSTSTWAWTPNAVMQYLVGNLSVSLLEIRGCSIRFVEIICETIINTHLEQSRIE